MQGEPEDIAREKCRLAAKAVGGAGEGAPFQAFSGSHSSVVLSEFCGLALLSRPATAVRPGVSGSSTGHGWDCNGARGLLPVVWHACMGGCQGLLPLFLCLVALQH